MTWIVILLVVLLVAFGPIMWLKPSAKDKRLAALRKRAREEGLSVEIVNIEKPFATPEERVNQSGIVRPAMRQYVLYSYPLEKRLNFVQTWRLVRLKDQQRGPIPGWLPESKLVEAVPNFWERVASFLPNLPVDTEIFELSDRLVGCYWQESKGADSAVVSALAQTLRAFSADMVMLDAKLAREQNDND